VERAGEAAGLMAPPDAQRQRGAAADGAGHRLIQGLADEGPCCFPKGDRPAAWNAARLTEARL